MDKVGGRYRQDILDSESMKARWAFPAENAHDGIPLANGIFGVLVHGGGSVLKLCINRADFWDHRGSLVWDERMNYRNVKRLLDEGKQDELKVIFCRTMKAGFPERPTHLPMGRYELLFEEGSRLTQGTLDMITGEAAVTVENGSRLAIVRVHMVKDMPAIAVKTEGDIAYSLRPVLVTEKGIRPKNGEPSSSYAVEYPYPFSAEDYEGWCQDLPADPSLAVLAVEKKRRDGREIYIAAERGQTSKDAARAAAALLGALTGKPYRDNIGGMESYWKGFWKKTALVKLDDKDIERLYYLGIYKMASISMAGGPPSTTQGPWIEDYRMPAWSSDYHFNINVQECYWPAFASNNLETLAPLFDMVGGWTDRMREYAKLFVGIEDGIQIPWAVDELCSSMGGSWTGAIDHGSTAWLGHIMWQYYRYSMDDKFLLETAYPFLRGALRVYQEMLEWDGERYHLPVSVSSEFKWDKPDCWGSNSTFQLLCIHFLCSSLLFILSKFSIEDVIEEVCRDIQEHTPMFVKGKGRYGDEIFVWDGQPLSESHRHHSHLAGIYPFDMIRYSDPADRELIDNSYRTWAYIGMGAWTGWCVPWAAILHARVGNGNMAEMLLQIFRRAFLMKGYASSHDTVFPGLSAFDKMRDLMQVEASIAAANSILEMLMFTSGGKLHLFPAIPDLWHNASFSGIRAEGGFLVDGELVDGKVRFIRITAESGGELTLINPMDGAAKIMLPGSGAEMTAGQDEEIKITIPRSQWVEIIPLDYNHRTSKTD